MMHQNVGFGKRGQMKVQQMAFMLVALTLFFVLVGLFVLSIGLSGLKGQKAALEEANAMRLVTVLANYPEFSCENAFDFEKTICVDFDKVMTFSKMNSAYSGFWKVNSVEIRRVYPELEGEVLCTNDNYPDCNYLRILSSGNSTGFDASRFVSLCRKEELSGISYNKCEIAKLIVRFGE